MAIHHVGIWVSDLERAKVFYEEFFPVTAGDKYHNPNKGFSSYFLAFEQGARIEIMSQPGKQPGQDIGHVSIALGSKEKVDQLVEAIPQRGGEWVSGPRTTGDGYYEAVVKDPDGNLLELTP